MYSKGILRLLLIALTLNIISAENVINDKQCGGTIELDSGSLEYYNNPDPIPGICVWTIHLQTMTDFKFRLRHLNIEGGGSLCPDASLGVYSLNNQAQGNIEGLKLCNENLFPGDYVYNGNTLAIVLKIDPYTTGFNVGFIIDFEGSNITPSPPKHTSSFTSASSGIFQYPIGGEYEPNAISTWVVQPNTLNEYTDIVVTDVGLEDCTTPGACFCDAFIVYEVTQEGTVEVAEQFCGDKISSNFTISGNKFIAVLFADSLDLPGGAGFKLLWRAGTEYTTTPTTTTTTTPTTTTTRTTTTPTTTTPTTTTERTTTTEDPNPPTLTSCGGTFEGSYGRISYKLNEDYGNSERCAWIIRSPNAERYVDLKKVTDGFETGSDYISAFAFDHDESQSTTLGKTTHDEETRSLSGSVVVIVFTSNVANIGQGFQLDFKFNGTYTDGNIIKYWNDYYSEDTSGLVQIGGREPGQHYENYEQSVFVMSRNNTYYDDIGWTAELLVYKVQESGIIIDPCYYDGIRVYSVALDSLSFVGKFCSDSEKSFGPFLARNLYIFVFSTSSSNNAGGFEISWKLR